MMEDAFYFTVGMNILMTRLDKLSIEVGTNRLAINQSIIDQSKDL